MADIFTAFGVDARLLGIQIFNFTLLAAALWYLLYRPVLTLLDARREEAIRAARALDEAQRLREEAMKEKDRILEDAANERHKLLEEAEAEARMRAKDIREAAQREATAIVAEAQHAAQRLKEKARVELEEEVARLVAQGVAKVCAQK